MREHRAMEKADKDRGEGRTRVTIAGKTSTRANFDPRKFALHLLEQRGKSKSLDERLRRQAEMEAKVG
jgi:hypothetical protein